MAADSKALLARSKALADTAPASYDEAMLSTSERMAEKLKQALKTKGMSQVAFATACGVSKQAVQSWIKTGRIDKKHLPKFVEVLGLPLSWWLEVEATTYLPATALTPTKVISTDTDTPNYVSSKWPFTSISPSEYNRLSDRQTGMVEGYIRALLIDAESSKRNGTTGH